MIKLDADITSLTLGESHYGSKIQGRDRGDRVRQKRCLMKSLTTRFDDSSGTAAAGKYDRIEH